MTTAGMLSTPSDVVTGRSSQFQDASSSNWESGCDDLYSAVYAVLDDAKKDRRLVTLYKGSHASPKPHPVVIDAGSALLRNGHGLFTFVATRANAIRAMRVNSGAGSAGPREVWEHFDHYYRPRVPVAAAFDQLVKITAHSGGSDTALAAHLIERRHALGHYRGGSTGFDDEARAFLAAHFTALGISVGVEDVTAFCGGAKGAFIAACAALMCTRVYDRLHHRGGVMLAPRGYYQSLRLIPPIFAALSPLSTP